MKISEGVFKCGFCGTIKEQNVGRTEGNGSKGVGVAQVECPKCHNNISQKTKIEMDNK